MDWRDRNLLAGTGIRRSLIRMAIPAVTSTFFMVLFEFIDMFWVARLGDEAMAALGGASFFIWMLRGLTLTVAAGALALTARRTGEQNEQGLYAAITESVGAVLFFAVFIILAFFLPALHIFNILGVGGSVANLASDYTTVFLSGFIFVCLMTTLEFIIRGLGDTKTPMKITMLALTLNMILDPVFMFALGMGLRGAALATITAQGIGALLMGRVLLKKAPALRTRSFFLRRLVSGEMWGRYGEVIRIGGPVALTDAGFSFIYLLLTGIIAFFGPAPLAAIGIAHRYEGFPFFICLGFSMAVEPMVGQFLGAGQVERARQAVYSAIKITLALVAIISIIYFIFAPQLFAFFSRDPGIVGHGVTYLRIVAFSDIFLTFEVVLTGAFSGAGDTRPPLLINFPLTLARAPLGYLAAVLLGGGIEWLWGIIGITTVLKGLLLFRQFRKGRWALKQI